MPRKKPRLKPPQKAALRRASADAIEGRMLRIASFVQRSLWLPPENGYFLQTAQKVSRHATANPPRLKKRPLADYIAVSCTLHSVDGWSNLARAFCALVQGDSDAARHFAYYAELRAAMALLASQGTGVFNKSHVIVDKSGECHPYNGPGTHNAVWMFLEHWGERKAANTVLKTIVRPGNRPLADWISAFAVGAVTPKLIAQQWCRLWGLDLKRLSKDRDARNESSYRPTQLQNPVGISAHVAADFIGDFWRIFRPWPPNFGILDAHLLRKVLQDTFVSSRGVPVTDPAFSTHVSQALSQVQPTGMTVAEWSTFLRDTSEPILITFANKMDDPNSPDHHMQVMSRAALLLRLASGASEKLMESAHISQNELDFWSSRFGIARGIWKAGEEPDDMLDLWQDVEEAVESLDSWKAANGPTASYSALRREQVVPLQILCECERIALWGVAP